MLYNKYKEILNSESTYPVESRLLYKHNFNRNDLAIINKNKYFDDDFIKLSLFDEKRVPLIYFNNEYVKNIFIDSENIIKDSNINNLNYFDDSEILNGFIFSEIESSLAIEGIRSTRAQIENLNKLKYEELIDKNDIIIKNMLLAYEFIRKSKITEENIYKLYNILSKKSLKKEDSLLKGNFYRQGEVFIVDQMGNIIDKGVSFDKLPEMMNDLIKFINMPKPYNEHLMSSIIIHYYIAYLHPYFDYNGRMARVMSVWYNLENAPSLSLLLVSEAINNKIHKKGYYNAIVNSRKANNDVTYFLQYMGEVILKYTKIHVNLNYALLNLKGDGHTPTRAIELAYKHVLSMPIYGEGYFTWKDYKDYSNDDFSKQYILRLLNQLGDFELLEVKESKKNNLYKLNLNKLYI